MPTVMTSEHPPMLYDYYGFPPESYTITWPAPGSPALAARVRALLGAAGIDAAADPARGYDHGTFVPLKLTYPDADVPTVQLSLKEGLDPAEHIAIGRALQPLRDEGVFIVGSGMTFHNLRAFRDPRAAPVSEAFDAWLRESLVLEAGARNARLARLDVGARGSRGAPARGAPDSADGGVGRRRRRPRPWWRSTTPSPACGCRRITSEWYVAAGLQTRRRAVQRPPATGFIAVSRTYPKTRRGRRRVADRELIGRGRRDARSGLGHHACVRLDQHLDPQDGFRRIPLRAVAQPDLRNRGASARVIGAVMLSSSLKSPAGS